MSSMTAHNCRFNQISLPPLRQGRGLSWAEKIIAFTEETLP